MYLGLLNAAASRSRAAWAAIPAAIVLGMAGALALATFVKAGATVFLGAPRTKAAQGAHECGPLMLAPMLALAGACAAIGLAPVLFWRPLERAAGSWHPQWAPSGRRSRLPRSARPTSRSPWPRCAAAALLWRKVRANGVRRAPTWDCGYSAPTARMQYSGGSFSGIAMGWFAGILGPERTLRRPHGPFPVRASWLERVPDTVLERVMMPAGDAVMRVSSATPQAAARAAPILYRVFAVRPHSCGDFDVDRSWAMTFILETILRLAVWLLVAPLLPGIINKVKAWTAGRRGPPVLQLYYDLARLWQKGVVMSTLASPGFIVGPGRGVGGAGGRRPPHAARRGRRGA